MIVKGDLSLDGQQHEWDAFEACYRSAFGERLHVVQGNHDAYSDALADFGIDYETYALGALEDRCCNIPLR